MAYEWTYPALSCDDPLPPCLVEPPGPVPVPHDTWRVLADNTPHNCDNEGHDESERLLAGIGSGVPPNMQRADGVGRGDGTRKCELELEDVETAERHGEENPHVSAAQCERDDPAVERLEIS